MDDTIVGLFPVGETVVVLVDRVKERRLKRGIVTCFCPFTSSLMDATNAVAFTLVGKKIPHVAFSGERTYVTNTSWARTVSA